MTVDPIFLVVMGVVALLASLVIAAAIAGMVEGVWRWACDRPRPRSGERPDKIINALPPPIRNVIESSPGKGYRLKIFDPPSGE